MTADTTKRKRARTPRPTSPKDGGVPQDGPAQIPLGVSTSDPEEPETLGPAGQAFWDSIAPHADLAEYELVQLRQACLVTDLIDALNAVVSREGAAVDDPMIGASKPHPCVVELRHQRVTLARLVGALRIPSRDGGTTPQRRTGVRGSYSPGGAP